MCDVHNLINVTLNQRLMLGALLSKRQASLFMSQMKRAIKIKAEATDSLSSSSTGSGGTDGHKKFGTKAQFSKKLKKSLLGFKTKGRLDRQLLQGIMLNTSERRKS